LDSSWKIDLELVHRKTLGFNDEFEGYVFLKESDRDRPGQAGFVYENNSESIIGRISIGRRSVASWAQS
jgi:hypothetical protein